MPAIIAGLLVRWLSCTTAPGCWIWGALRWCMTRGETTLSCDCFSSRRRHTGFDCDWSSDVCSSDLHRADYLAPPQVRRREGPHRPPDARADTCRPRRRLSVHLGLYAGRLGRPEQGRGPARGEDRKSTRLNSSHSQISYAVFCLKKKT